MVEILIKEGSDVTAKQKNDYTALHFAAEKGHFRNLFRLLWRTHTQMLIISSHFESQTSKHPLGDFSIFRSIKVVPILSLNNKKVFLYHSGHLEAAELLIQAESDVNAKEEDSYTPLHLATQNGKSVILMNETFWLNFFQTRLESSHLSSIEFICSNI